MVAAARRDGDDGGVGTHIRAAGACEESDPDDKIVLRVDGRFSQTPDDGDDDGDDDGELRRRGHDRSARRCRRNGSTDDGDLVTGTSRGGRRASPAAEELDSDATYCEGAEDGVHDVGPRQAPPGSSRHQQDRDQLEQQEEEEEPQAHQCEEQEEDEDEDFEYAQRWDDYPAAFADSEDEEDAGAAFVLVYDGDDPDDAGYESDVQDDTPD
ncbi:hypothetical protein ONE63_003410 [Megalurothrips usitatus]|uniref:Uncharacterized protein n=1 Tax=Megalurothrips usitatus TaxID=439358 RepID=A0AAV7XE85_9NEOP|nr:hypothetical protein ONE63_003410 [Megalurothrips usitatus]